MPDEHHLQPFCFGAIKLKLYVPPFVHARQAPVTDSSALAPAPYWAKVWPSAIALGQFIASHPHFTADKQVLELAAGLGLPGLVAAQHAAVVTLSDYLPAAVMAMQYSVDANGCTNVACELIDWTKLPAHLRADVLLLSDVNYDPGAFEVLHAVLTRFLNEGTTILLATPQRLMAKPFIELLLPFSIQQDEEEVLLAGERAFISVLVLRK